MGHTAHSYYTYYRTYNTCIHGIHASESTHEQIPNIMEVDRIHIQMISLDLIHIRCGDVSNMSNAKLTSTTLRMLDTLRILNYTYGIIHTVVRIVGMDRMSHICNTKCSRL